MKTYLLFSQTGTRLSSQRIAVGFRMWIKCQGCGAGIVVRADCSSSHSILRGRLGSGIDNRKRVCYMADKHTDDKLYRVVRKEGNHLNTKVNPDGSKSALQFTDDNNDLSGPVDLIEVDEEELIRTEYVQVLQEERSLGERLVDEVVIPVIRDATTQLLEYGTAKAEVWIEEKAVPAAKAKVRAGWENFKLFISALKDSNKPIKTTQINAEQQKTPMTGEIEVSNKVEHQEEKRHALSPEDVEILLDTARRSALMIAASLSILNNSVVMDDGTDPERIAMIQRGIEQLSSKDITTQIDLLLEDKNNGLIDATSITMLRAFRNGMFIGNGTPIPVSRYIEADKEIKDIIRG